MFLLFAVHIFFTLKLNFVQRHTLKGIKYSFHPDSALDGIGTYRAFASALGTTIGPGNITGVALAISMGGPGAVFWMWLSGVVAMSTKYAESYLSLRYTRKINNTSVGGTMVLLNKLGNYRLSKLWALFCAVGGLFMGAAVPSNSLSHTLACPDWFTGFLLAFFTLVTVSFGVKGIANVCSLVVPVMSCGFMLFSLFLLFRNPTAAVNSLKIIITNAFDFKTAFIGTMSHGITRGLYSNESGLGTGGVLAAESGDKNTVLSSLAAMTTAFWDTVVMCALTGVVFVTYGADKGLNPDLIMKNAFNSVVFGSAFLSVSMSLFVFATVIGWYYIAKRALVFLSGRTAVYDFLYISFLFFGAVINSDLLWSAADAVNIALLLPSVYAIIKLSDKINLYIKDK